MASNMTQPTDVSVEDFIAAVEHPVRRADAVTLDGIFREVPGWSPRMWGPTIIGYGSYDYTYDTGYSGTSLATGFSPRKANQVLYIMPGYQDYAPLLERIGKHKLGKSCLYLTQLKNNDLDVIAELIALGVKDLSKKYPVSPS